MSLKFATSERVIITTEVTLELSSALDAFVFFDLLSYIKYRVKGDCAFVTPPTFKVLHEALEHVYASRIELKHLMFGQPKGNTPPKLVGVKWVPASAHFQPGVVSFQLDTENAATALITILRELTTSDSLATHFVAFVSNPNNHCDGLERLVVSSMVSNIIKKWVPDFDNTLQQLTHSK